MRTVKKSTFTPRKDKGNKKKGRVRMCKSEGMKETTRDKDPDG